ncbi:hypothetical protein PAEPH01_0472 [Pancytospora epiphaga]|nr:hypothetical protein PAEPH01_0472 [Pancytospora epiphaga]
MGMRIEEEAIELVVNFLRTARRRKIIRNINYKELQTVNPPIPYRNSYKPVRFGMGMISDDDELFGRCVSRNPMNDKREMLYFEKNDKSIIKSPVSSFNLNHYKCKNSASVEAYSENNKQELCNKKLTQVDELLAVNSLVSFTKPTKQPLAWKQKIELEVPSSVSISSESNGQVYDFPKIHPLKHIYKSVQESAKHLNPYF